MKCLKTFSILFIFFLLAGLIFLLLNTEKPKKPPHIILICIDTLRSDHLGCYEYDRDTSPNLDRFSEDGILFQQFFSQSPSTTPSHLSLFSSLYTLSHGIRANAPSHIFSNKITLLQEILRGNGYQTAAFTGNGWISKIFGFSRGFDYWSEKHRNIQQHLPGVQQWVHANKNKPFYLFFHFYDVHAPYRYRQRYRSMFKNPSLIDEVKSFSKKVTRARENQQDLARFFKSLSARDRGIGILYSYTRELLPSLLVYGEDSLTIKTNRNVFNHFLEKEWGEIPEYHEQLQFLIDSYDAGIRDVDRHLGIFFAFLKKSGVWKDSLIILTSDHGEEFMEHNMLGHERHLYDTLLQVPLIIKLPDTTPKRVSRIAQLTEMVDIMPTILDYLNIAPLSQAQGKSLLPFLRGKETDHKEQIFAAVSSREKQSHFSSMVRNNRLKCIIPDRIHPSILQFYTIGSNHGEEQPDFSISEPASNILMRVLKEHQNNCLKLYHLKYSRNRTEIGQDHTQSKKVKQNLKTLGYLK